MPTSTQIVNQSKIEGLPEPENKINSKSSYFKIAESTTSLAAAHIGGTISTGYVAVHAPEITGYITAKICGEGILNWGARYALAGKISPYLLTGAGTAGSLVTGAAVLLAFKGIEYAYTQAVNSYNLSNHQVKNLELQEGK